MSNNYGTPPVVVVRGAGALVWDDQGREYLDMMAGIAVNALGHAHPAVRAAITKQAGEYGHTSNLAIHPVGVELAERLLDMTGRQGRVFFCNSGAEANEAAFKVARLTGRHTVHAATGSFHGRTMGALSLTGQPPKRAPFEPLVPGVDFFEFGQVPRVGPDSAAIIIEPIQGEAGVIPAPRGYLQQLRGQGALLIADEVQTGIGRTGRWLAVQHEDVAPDMITLAKGLGGGLPIGALLTFGETAELLSPGSTGAPSGAIRSPARPPWRCSTRSRPTVCCSTPWTWGAGSPTLCRTRPVWKMCAGAGCCSGWSSRNPWPNRWRLTVATTACSSTRSVTG